MKKSTGLLFIIFTFCGFGFTCCGFGQGQQPIDRKALVERHTARNSTADTLSPFSVGNGRFAFTVDVTGLQSFPAAYENGIPLGTQSEWGWHSFSNPQGFRFDETLRSFNLNGKTVSYSVQTNEPGRAKNAVDWYRQNPHRLHLGNIGFELIKKDGSVALLSDIQNIQQSLNMWTGEIHSTFTLEDVKADIITYGHQQQDAISVKVSSLLLNEGRLRIRVRFPYPTGEWKDGGSRLELDNRHRSLIEKSSANAASIRHELDKSSWFVNLKWSGKARVDQKDSNYFVVLPLYHSTPATFEFSVRFAEQQKSPAPSFVETRDDNMKEWLRFWTAGGVVDFSGSTDKRAIELERRIVLSQYLTRIQCAGYNPPQETGLTFNSWYGRPHLEMHWWHSIHFSLWGRNELTENTLSWYGRAAEKGRAIAERQGYGGIRWQKMTDNEGNETPSSVGAFLIWQQPHFIYFAELCYRNNPGATTIAKYKDLVSETADFMVSYAHYDSIRHRYVLGPGLIPAQERFDPLTTINPAYELVYWYWALQTAQSWRVRAGMQPVKKWDEVLQSLSPLIVKDSKYLFTENAVDSYTNPVYHTDHPSVLGSLGMLPQTKFVDTTIMRSTFNWIWQNWKWEDTWGWDFPMTAMTATRLGLPKQAVEALLKPVPTNTYLNNGHNYQDKRLTLYLPGNGGLLAAVAMMCAGYDGCKTDKPGIPKNGKWTVRWEGLKRMP